MLACAPVRWLSGGLPLLCAAGCASARPRGVPPRAGATPAPARESLHVSVVYPVSTDTEFFDVMTRHTGVEVARAFGPRQNVQTVADAIARAIDRPTAEVYPYFGSRFLVVMNAIAPGFTDRIVRRFGRRPLR